MSSEFGAEKNEGHPQPESYLSSDVNRGASQQMQEYSPVS